LDYWPHLLWETVDDWTTLIERLPDRQPWLVSKTGGTEYTQVHYERGDVLVFGSESAGLPRALLEAHRRRCLRIPIRPQIRSLNLSVCVGILAFEARRQWEAGLAGITQSGG
jgi:tRNA (cytidine/uridine-2'-O-)-methyltransferase